ncbi:LytTR family DNA-binding domain-containing protein [Janthinobacterium sp. SUN128]|uniref:Response regulator transcription factor n=1 Tax=Janthinobacterium lividum TaxID=29581 RepID=A0AAJ4T6M0_9BURK|nr:MULTISPECIES: LytTR family DNA-binding domain-containing protein [Janthinobacterium]KAB0331504.1 response regulator transcription factor [Janthinobacterium lividum]MDO8035998.1 LytTR family DNA-binding domain-containing protein [Janthinobacterium sp. SUN128]QSX97698.1 response regulator transcription factor [Janthinobacterium lividum]UGQ37650.1 LytTR family DNA-binding domain-containing protein [Janthinobacterium sp. PLB04]
MSQHTARAPRALIAEDEPILAAALAHALQRLWPELDIVATCPNGVEALRQGLALQPDILFLDIKMPGKTGLEAAEELAELWPDGVPFPHIVFVTAYDEYALAAFEHAAADYVLKPVNDARLGKTVERLQQRLRDIGGGNAAAAPANATATAATMAPAAGSASDDNMARLLSQLQAMLPPAPRLQMIRAAVGNSVRMIALADVVYFEALDKYINVVCQDSEALIRTSLKELLPQLDPQQFWQIHRGTIVNASAIATAVRDEAGKLSLTLRQHPAQLRVSPLYAHLFRQM